ncbi:MAG: hypothetical protein HYR71_02860 [Chloroflexi bacterium]|nr:hypothetical protein [Chloroflexota bacterium]
MSLRHQLTHLEQAGLIQLAAPQPELAYVFRHALIQDAAYSSLLRRERQALHRRLGEILEGEYAGRLDEVSAVLAQHFAEAQDDARALTYFTRAGDAAARLYANVEAMLHYERALEIAVRLRRAGAAVEPSLLPDLFQRRGRLLEVTGRYDDALAGYHRAQALARELGDRRLELSALIALATLRSIASPAFDARQARAHLESALALAEALADRAAEARLLWGLQLLTIYSGGDPAQAIDFGERSLALAEALDLREQVAFTTHDLFIPYQATGQVARARAVLETSRARWRALDNLPMLAESLVFSSNHYLLAGDYERALAFADEALAVGREGQHLYSQAYSRFWVCRVYIDRGEYGRAIALMEEAIGWGEQANHLGILIITRADLGWVYGLLGDDERGRALAAQALALAEERLPHFVVVALTVLAQLYLMQGETDQAAQAMARVTPDPVIPDGIGDGGWFELKHTLMALPLTWISTVLTQAELALAQADPTRALALAAELASDATIAYARFHRPDLLHLQGRALRVVGRVEEAYQALSAAQTAAEALGNRRVLWPVLRALAELDAQRGDSAQAEARRARAAAIIA